MNKQTSKIVSSDPLTLVLILGSAICIALLAFRVYFSSSTIYSFFIWNLFLAWIPFLLSQTITSFERKGKSNLILGGLFSVWLLFFPNSPYIITDLFHLKKTQNIPLWYDLILIVSFAWNGLMIGYISLIKIQSFLNRKFKPKTSWIIIVSILCLSAFGIYLGRFERWNSWDIITNPSSLFGNIFEKILNPLSHPKTLGVTLFFSIFLITGYLTLFHLMRSKHEH